MGFFALLIPLFFAVPLIIAFYIDYKEGQREFFEFFAREKKKFFLAAVGFIVHFALQILFN